MFGNERCANVIYDTHNQVLYSKHYFFEKVTTSHRTVEQHGLPLTSIITMMAKECHSSLVLKETAGELTMFGVSTHQGKSTRHLVLVTIFLCLSPSVTSFFLINPASVVRRWTILRLPHGTVSPKRTNWHSLSSSSDQRPHEEPTFAMLKRESLMEQGVLIVGKTASMLVSLTFFALLAWKRDALMGEWIHRHCCLRMREI